MSCTLSMALPYIHRPCGLGMMLMHARVSIAAGGGCGAAVPLCGVTWVNSETATFLIFKSVTR